VPHGFAPAGDGGESVRDREAGGPAGGLVLGARGPRKGLDVWARAVVGLEPVVPWTLVGRPPRGVLARAHGVPVEVLNDPDDAEVARRLAGAAVLVYPSRSEGFGYPPLEAMAAGVPVVASAAGAIPEVVGDARCSLPPGARRAPGALQRSSATRRAAGLVARGAARARAFPPEATARSLLKIVREAVERGGA
jgi:glycosyltransferase involved in cell wall biosynthesis